MTLIELLLLDGLKLIKMEFLSKNKNHVLKEFVESSSISFTSSGPSVTSSVSSVTSSDSSVTSSGSSITSTNSSVTSSSSSVTSSRATTSIRGVFNFFNKLPTVLKREIINSFSLSEIGMFSRTSMSNYSLAKSSAYKNLLYASKALKMLDVPSLSQFFIQKLGDLTDYEKRNLLILIGKGLVPLKGNPPEK